MNHSRLAVEIITQEAQMYAGTVDKITLPGVLGEMTILPEHESLMSILAAGEVTLYDGETVKRLVISPGFVQITKDAVSVLTDSATHEEALSEKRAAEARQAAEEAMEEVSSATEIAMTLGTIDRTMVEMKAIRRRHGSHSNQTHEG